MSNNQSQSTCSPSQLVDSNLSCQTLTSGKTSRLKYVLALSTLSLSGLSQVACAELVTRASDWQYSPVQTTTSNQQVITPSQGQGVSTTSQTTIYRRPSSSRATPRASTRQGSTTYPSPQYQFDTPQSPVVYRPPAVATFGSYQGNTGYSGVESFNQAKSAADRGDNSALYQYEQAMAGSLLAMYPTYWRLENSLSTLNPDVVAQFVRQYKGSVMAEKLVADYVEAKAMSGDYASIRQVADLVVNADRSEACAVAMGYNYNSSDLQRVRDIKPEVWLATRKQPELCQQLATQMINSPVITNADREQRLYRMLREGRTGDILALSQSLGVPIQYSDLSAIQLNPNSFLSRFNTMPLSEATSQKNQYLYLYAIGHIAKRSYREAATQVDYDARQNGVNNQKRLADPTLQYAYRMLGVQRMNSNTDDGFNQEAVTWFHKSLGLPFNFEESEDYAQAAIRFSQWQDVITAIDSMNADTQEESIWLYWRARAYEQMGGANRRLANQIYQNLARQNDYYGLLAKDKVGQNLNLRALGGTQVPSISAQDTARVLQNQHFARAFALFDGGVDRSYANREWNWAVKQANDINDSRLILAAAKLANDKGWLDRSIYAIDSSDVDNLPLAYPMPYRSAVVRYSSAAGIDPAWAYGIMRQESRFVNNARSGVGASGLMQVMPDTARYIARQLGESYSASRANSGDTNIRYGTWYMGDVMSKLDYQPVLATAGYNAGPNKARRWQPAYGSLPADQYIESIAYPETRNYVKRVMENATIYSHLLGQPQSITQRMGTIPPA